MLQNNGEKLFCSPEEVHRRTSCYLAMYKALYPLEEVELDVDGA